MELPCQERLNCDEDSVVPYSENQGLEYFLCNDCGIIWRDPSSDLPLRTDYGADYQAKYQRRARARRYKAGFQLDIIESHFAPGKLAEIGPSVGHFLETARNRGWEVNGFDISLEAVDACREKELDVKHGSVERLTPDTYDLVVMRHVLEHFPNPFQVLDQVNASLREGGGVFIAVPNSNYRKSRKKRGAYKGFQPTSKGVEHTVYFNYQSLRWLLEETDFRVLQENYPIFTSFKNNPLHMIDRGIRRAENLFDLDKEILVLAEKDEGVSLVT